MSYDIEDIFRRIKQLLPARWFGEETPVLDSILRSYSVPWAKIRDFIDFVVCQTRVTTSYDKWLDLAAWDYFGSRIKRYRLETDVVFRRRILFELNRDKCTRTALYQCLVFLTGHPPKIFEPCSPGDTGCYGLSATSGLGTLGYGLSGGWGSLSLPFQIFVRIRRPVQEGIALVNGWNGFEGGFGAGRSVYVGLSSYSSGLTEAQLYEYIGRTAPAGTRIWVAIEP